MRPPHQSISPAAAATGYDPQFLGVDVPLPELADVPSVVLPYTHFTVRLRPDRRLAAVSSVMIDGASIVDIERSADKWLLDPRVPVLAQAGEAVYAHNELDRGHLTRRRDPGWGPDATAANSDTFHYTNAAPQAAQFNQSKELWNGLEDYLLDNAATHDRRLIVHTGPVLDPADPPYRGVQIPLQFYKVVGFLDAGELASTGYVLDQSPELDDIDLDSVLAERAAAGDPPPLGPYKTYQAPVADLAAVTGLDFGPLLAVDRFTAAGETAASGAWRQLTGYQDIAH